MSYLTPHLKAIKFIVSGGSAAVVEYVTFFLMVHFMMIAVIIAQPISFCFGLVVSFFLNKYWVFASSGKSAYKKEVPLFLMLGITNLVVTTLLIDILTAIIPVLIAKFILMACVAIWNYIIFKTIIFRNH